MWSAERLSPGEPSPPKGLEFDRDAYISADYRD
jgi:hypothetical protein